MSEWWCGGSGESGGFTATTCTDDYVDPVDPSQRDKSLTSTPRR